ncbi:hypothetical protein amrb99_98320 [Actinomadura sp. RB99]|nr:hypothetical protein [Actinomadura sp. RB99]
MPGRVEFPDLPKLARHIDDIGPAERSPVVGMNPRFLGRAVTALAPRWHGAVRVTNSTPTKPVLITLPDDDAPALTALIMPVLLDETGRP